LQFIQLFENVNGKIKHQNEQNMEKYSYC